MKEAYEYGTTALRIGIIIMSMGGIVLYFGAPWFATWFTNDSEVIGKIITLARIDAFAQIPVAVSVIFAGALQGMGDTNLLFTAQLSACVVLGF